MNQQKKSPRQSAKFQNELSVYVAGLPAETTYWDLREILSQFGEVSATFVSTLKPGQTFKYGFGCFKFQASLLNAVNAQGSLFVKGAKVTIRPRSPKDWKGKDNMPVIVAAPPPSPAIAMFDGSAVFHSAVSGTLVGPPFSITADTARPFSTLMQPPDFTNYVHDTLASQFHSQRKLQAALRPDTKMQIVETRELGVSESQAYEASPVHTSDPVKTGCVVRVDGVPATWGAIDLFSLLDDHGVPTTAVLVYDDFDERGLRQGLIQLETSENAEAMCAVGSLHSPEVTLQFVFSCIGSIGRIQRTYSGRYSVYVRDFAGKEAYGYTASGYTEFGPDDGAGIAHPTNQQQDLQIHNHPHDDGQYSSLCGDSTDGGYSEDETPGTVVAANSPVGKLADHDDGAGYEMSSASDRTPVDSEDYHSDAALGEAYLNGGDPTQHHQTLTGLHLTKSAHSSQGPPFYEPMKMHMRFTKVSQTVIVDNFDSRLIGDRESLATWMSQYGELQSLDIVQMANNRTRAYISYMSPYDAHYTSYRLQMCMSGSFRLIVRLA